MASISSLTGNPITTLKHTCGDAAETLIDDVTGFVAQRSVTTGPGTVNENVIAVLITCEDNDIRFAWGTNPVQSGVGHILYVGQSLKLTNHKQIIDFRFINKTAQSNAVLMITPETSRI